MTDGQKHNKKKTKKNWLKKETDRIKLEKKNNESSN